MRNTLKFLLPGALALAFFAAPAIVPTVAAQDTAAAAAGACNPEEKAAIDKKFRDNYKTNKEVAYQAAKDYLAKCGNDTETADFVKYLQTWISKYDAAKIEEGKLAIAKKCSDPVTAGIKATNPTEKAKYGSDIFSGCQQFSAQEPNSPFPYLLPVDYGYTLASANPPVNTYNDQTIALAKQALQKIESNSLGDVKWADYNYKSREDALSWLNYIIGFITFNNLTGKEADSVPYFYKSLQYPSDIKNKPLPYYAIGFNYRTQYNKAVQDFQAKYANATDVTDDMKKDIGVQKALADRAIDAFARAYKTAVDSKLSQQFIDARKGDLEKMYKIRNKDQTTDWNTLAASIASKPLPDPASPVTPVMEETPATTATGATSGATAAVTSTPETKAAASSGNGNGNGTRERTAPASATTTTAKPETAKPAAKPATTPAPKKPSR